MTEDTASEPSSAIQLRRMPQQQMVYDAEDDWTGITDSKARRKIQNRLHQRAYRLRREARLKDSHPTSSTDHSYYPNYNERPRPHDATILHPNYPLPHIQSLKHPATLCKVPESEHVRCTFAPPNVHALMTHFETHALGSFLHGSPNADHRLTLSRLNILRAAYENVVAAGMPTEWLCSDDAVSIFSLDTGTSTRASHWSVPISLQPTETQRAILHHPWLDVFPFPRIRDNMIQAGSSLDDDELCHDLTGFWDTRRSDATLLVWGQPWDPRNWEATEAFVKKWSWVLRGCSEILVSSNRWRVRRGEKPLRWRDVLGEGE